jgi:ABC-2 type transport system permease protein
MIERIKDLWVHRELLWNMTVKELRVKYKRSVLGFLWSFMNPIIMLAVFSLVFSILVKNNMKWFVVYLMSGLLPWIFFTNSLMQSVGTIVTNAGLVKKVYFPREILPIAAVGANIFHFAMQMVVMFVFLIALRWHFSPWLAAFPLVLLMQVMFTLGLALFISAANVYLRDVQYFVEVATMAWFWITPIVYTMNLVVPKLGDYLPIYLLNPMTNIVLCYQYIIYNPRYYGPQAAYISKWGVIGTGVVSIFLLAFGYYFFYKTERGFAEQI